MVSLVTDKNKVIKLKNNAVELSKFIFGGRTMEGLKYSDFRARRGGDKRRVRMGREGSEEGAPSHCGSPGLCPAFLKLYSLYMSTVCQ